MWGTDGKDHTGGQQAIQKKDHKLGTDGNTHFCALILSTNQPMDNLKTIAIREKKLGSCMGTRWKRSCRKTMSNPEERLFS